MDEIFDNDPQLLALHQRYRFYLTCGSRSYNTASDNDALKSVKERLGAEGLPLPPDEEIIGLVQRYRQARTDFSMEEELNHEVFTLEQDIQNRRGTLVFNATYDPLLQGSPVKPAGITANELLRRLYPNGEHVLLFQSSRNRAPEVWTAEADNAQAPWFWPLAVTHAEDAHEEDLIKNPAAVADWNSATIILGTQQVRKLAPSILAGQVRVRSIVINIDDQASVIFAIEAQDKKEWNARCRELRTQLAGLGIEVPPFRYDWLAHLPGQRLGKRLIYLSP